MLKINKQKYPLKIQLFGEDKGENGGDGAEKTPEQDNAPKNKYSDEDYLKLKSHYDKLASEQAELKKQIKNKMSEEEIKAEEDKVKAQELENMKKELATYKIKSALSTVFDEEETEKISKVLMNGTHDEIAKLLVESRKNYKEKIYAEAKKEFSQSAKIPGGNSDDAIPSDVQSIIDKKKKSSATNARDYYFGNSKK